MLIIVAGNASMYKTPLRDYTATSGGGGGLKRSHSSPNIAKLMQDEISSNRQPWIDRNAKPKYVSLD